jgi:hypothetical protein
VRNAQLGRWAIDMQRAALRLHHRRAAIKGWRTRRVRQEIEERIAGGYRKCPSCPRTILSWQDVCGRCWSKKHAEAP